MRFTTPKLVALALAGGLTFATHVVAQEPAAQPETAPSVQQSQYTDQELDMFASSYSGNHGSA